MGIQLPLYPLGLVAILRSVALGNGGPCGCEWCPVDQAGIPIGARGPGQLALVSAGHRVGQSAVQPGLAGELGSRCALAMQMGFPG